MGIISFQILVLRLNMDICWAHGVNPLLKGQAERVGSGCSTGLRFGRGTHTFEASSRFLQTALLSDRQSPGPWSVFLLCPTTPQPQFFTQIALTPFQASRGDSTTVLDTLD